MVQKYRDSLESIYIVKEVVSGERQEKLRRWRSQNL